MTCGCNVLTGPCLRHCWPTLVVILLPILAWLSLPLMLCLWRVCP